MAYAFAFILIIAMIVKAIQAIIEHIDFVATKGEEGKKHTLLLIGIAFVFIIFLCALISDLG